MGEQGHIDLHHLSRYVIRRKVHKLYVMAVVDDYSRLMWAELLTSPDSVSVMFSVMRCFTELRQLYGVQFTEVLTDNGKEFGGADLTDKSKHPFERLLMEMGAGHRYTQFYRPQTNGKVERLWRSLEEDLLQDTRLRLSGRARRRTALVCFLLQRAQTTPGNQRQKPIGMIPPKSS